MAPRVKECKTRRCRRELVVLNYYQDGCPFDFTLELHKTEASVERHKAKIELGDNHNILETGLIEALPDLISDLRYIKGILNGRFDILVIEEDHEIHTDSAGANITNLEEQSTCRHHIRHINFTNSS